MNNKLFDSFRVLIFKYQNICDSVNFFVGSLTPESWSLWLWKIILFMIVAYISLLSPFLLSNCEVCRQKYVCSGGGDNDCKIIPWSHDVHTLPLWLTRDTCCYADTAVASPLIGTSLTPPASQAASLGTVTPTYSDIAAVT